MPSALITQLAAYSFVRPLPALARRDLKEDGRRAVPHLLECWGSEFGDHFVCWVRR